MRIEIFGLRVDISTRGQRAARRPAGVGKHVANPKPEKEASEDFWGAFCGSATIVAQCACGRTTFATNTTMDYDDGELEDLLAKEAAEPDKYIGDAENDGISVIDMPDGIIVWGCPCHKAARYENFLIGYRRPVLEFYRRVIKHEATVSAEAQAAFQNAQKDPQ